MADVLVYMKDHNTLYAGNSLISNGTIGQKLLSSGELNKDIFTGIGTSSPDWMNAMMQDDGNFVVYFAEGHARTGRPEGHPKWASGTNGRGTGPYKITLYSNGNLILTDKNGTELWRAPLSRSVTKEPCRLVMQDDGNLVIYDAKDVPLWASGTDGQTHV